MNKVRVLKVLCVVLIAVIFQIVDGWFKLLVVFGGIIPYILLINPKVKSPTLHIYEGYFEYSKKIRFEDIKEIKIYFEHLKRTHNKRNLLNKTTLIIYTLDNTVERLEVDNRMYFWEIMDKTRKANPQAVLPVTPLDERDFNSLIEGWTHADGGYYVKEINKLRLKNYEHQYGETSLPVKVRAGLRGCLELCIIGVVVLLFLIVIWMVVD